MDLHHGVNGNIGWSHYTMDLFGDHCLPLVRMLSYVHGLYPAVLALNCTE